MSDQPCPRCGAVRRPGDQWCGLCYADFREAAPPVVGDGPPTPTGAAPAAPAVPDAGAPPLIRPPDPPGGLPPAPPPVPQPPPAQPPPAQPPPAAAPSPFVPSTNPLAPAATIPTQPAPGVAPTAPAPAAAAPAAAGQPANLTWPCPSCQSPVAMSEDYCPACGTGFLQDAVTGGAVKVPLIGDVRRLNSGQKLAFGSAIAVGVVVVIVVLLTIGGHVF